MVGLPKYIIKKYGVSKKAWAVFRGKAKNAGHTARAKVVKMARRYGRRRGGSGGFGRMLSIPRNAKQIERAAIGGIFGGIVGGMLGQQFAPQYAKLASMVGAAYGGGLGGVVINEVATPKLVAMVNNV